VNGQLRGTLGRTELALRHWRSEGTSEYSDFFLTPLDQDFETSTTAAEVAFPVGTSVRGQVTVSRYEDHIDQNQSEDYLRTVRNSVGSQFDWQANGRHAIGAGILLAREDAESESFGEPMRAETDVINLYVQDAFESGSHRALVALGYTDHETAGDAVTGNLEYGYTFERGTQLYGLAGSGFRAPDATDRYGIGGNPDLEPERSRNLEVGVRQQVDGGHMLSLAAFRNDIDELIEFVTLCNGPGDPHEDCEGFSGENRNVDRARIEGIEASWEYDAAPWRVRVDATHQDPRNLTTGERLLRRAANSATASVQRSFGRMSLGLDVLVAGDRKDFGFPEPVTLDGYVLANLTARWQLSRTFALVGRIENLLDEEYELADTFNTPDRGLYVSLRYAPADHASSVVSAAGAGSPAAVGIASAATATHAKPLVDSFGETLPASRGAYSDPEGRSRQGQPWAID
jgi:vitamin B12 transporter